MWLISAEKIKELQSAWIKVPTVNETCIGCSACVAISGDVFELDENWISFVKDDMNKDSTSIDDAISACPVDAISYLD
jgi:ferredoxin